MYALLKTLVCNSQKFFTKVVKYPDCHESYVCQRISSKKRSERTISGHLRSVWHSLKEASCRYWFNFAYIPTIPSESCPEARRYPSFLFNYGLLIPLSPITERRYLTQKSPTCAITTAIRELRQSTIIQLILLLPTIGNDRGWVLQRYLTPYYSRAIMPYSKQGSIVDGFEDDGSFLLDSCGRDKSYR